jgi:hypothetical protein
LLFRLVDLTSTVIPRLLSPPPPPRGDDDEDDDAAAVVLRLARVLVDGVGVGADAEFDGDDASFGADGMSFTEYRLVNVVQSFSLPKQRIFCGVPVTGSLSNGRMLYFRCP